MTDTLRERVAEIFTKAEYGFPFSKLVGHSRKRMLNSTDAAIAIIRNETLEEAARVAEAFPARTHGNLATAPYAAAEQAADEIAAAIRALKDAP